MNEDHLLRALGQLAREEERAEKARLDPRWDRLAAGTLTADEEAELHALAESSPEAREAWKAFQPLGPEFQARMVEQIAAELPKKGKVLPFRPAARIGGWLTAAAAAAAIAVMLLRPAAHLPVYTAHLEGGAQTFRGSEPAPASGQPVFFPGSQLTLVARPSEPVKGRKLETRRFLSPQTGTGDLTPWTPEPQIGEHGSVRLRGTLGQEIRISPGAWTAWVVIGRKGRLPSADELRSELLAGRSQPADWRSICNDLPSRRETSIERWQVVCANLLVEDRPSG